MLPFLIGLLLSIGLRKFTVSAWIWAVFAAFLVSVGLINGLTITPLTGTRKIILLILASFFVAGFIHHLILGSNLRRSTLSAYCLLGLFWVFWKVMARMDGMAMTLSLAGAVGLVLWLLWAFDRIGNNDSQLHGAGFSLLLGTGLAATAGSSALLGQLALSLSAASGALEYDPAAKSASVTIEIDAGSVDTGHAKRDEHLSSPDFLNVVENPTITFKSTKVGWSGSKMSSVTGDLTIMGVSKPVTLKVTSIVCGEHTFNKKQVCGFDAEASIKRSDFGVNYGIPAIGEVLDLNIELEAVKN